MPTAEPPHIVILAADAGRRMTLEHPKALYPVFFRPMIHHALDAAMALPHRSLTVVVGRGEREFREQCRAYPDLRFARLAETAGPADAVRAAASASREGGDALVLLAGAVLLSAHAVLDLLARHAESGAALTVGRAEGGAAAVYCFRAEALEGGGAPEAEYRLDPAEGILIDDFHGLWRVETILRERFNRALMINGTALQDPLTTLIDPRCRIGPDVRIEGGCTIINSVLEQGARVEAACRIVDSEIGRGTVLRQGSCVERAKIGRDCQVGPYFISDAKIGRGVTVGSEVFIGGAAQAIAPVTVGAGSFVATGTSVTEDAPPGSFVISRGRQVTKPGYAKKHGKTEGPGAPR